MKNIRFFVESFYLRQALYRLGLMLCLFMFCRICFFIFNYSKLPTPSVSTFFWGIRFDLSAAIYINILLLLSYLLPFGFRKERWYGMIQRVLFLATTFVIVLVELGDAAYFPFSQRRLIAGDFLMIGNESDQLLRLVLEYWVMWIVFGLIIWGLNALFNKTTIKPLPQENSLLPQTGIMVLGLGLALMGVRGGIQMRPLTAGSAAQYVDDMRLAPLVGNSTLSILYSLSRTKLEVPNYMTPKEAEQVYEIFDKGDKTKKMRRMNVVVIALESFGKEYSAFFNQDKPNYPSYMPFVDSLAQQSLYAQYSYANGLRSTQGITALASGLPSLMGEPFMFSHYQTNKIKGWASVLKKQGYKTAFYHGSNHGSMAFNTFIPHTGFEYFYDRLDYPNQADYDGSWGIWDEPFWQWTLQKINALPQPFGTMTFSLTSHEPFAVPKDFEAKYPDVPKIKRSFLYADYALRRFFEEAKKQPWYQNTLFVVSADHVGRNDTRPEEYSTREGLYHIPILFFCPSDSTMRGEIKGGICSQVDVMPSILDYLNCPDARTSFGRSIFSKEAPPQYAVQYEDNLFQIEDKNYILLFDGRYTTGIFDKINDKMLKNNLIMQGLPDMNRMETALKAIIQQHHQAMVNNALVPK